MNRRATKVLSNRPAEEEGAQGEGKQPVSSGPPREPTTVTSPVPPNGGSVTVPSGCSIAYHWNFSKTGLTAAIADSNGPGRLEMSSNGPVPLAAKSEDTHILVHECYCGQTVTRTWYILDALIRYEWQVVSGGGGFIQKNGGPSAPKDSGQQVIYQPPNIDEIYPEPGSVSNIRIQVASIHNDPSKPPVDHDHCVLDLNLTVARTAKDKYIYEWGVVTPVEIKNQVPLLGTVGACKNVSTWLQQTPIGGGLQGPRQCAPGDYVRFEAKVDDTDSLNMQCLPGGLCKEPANQILTMSDILHYNWTSRKGKFVKTPTKDARQIVWKAPKDEGSVDISVRIEDSGTEFDDPTITLGRKIEVKNPPSRSLVAGGRPKKKKLKKKLKMKP